MPLKKSAYHVVPFDAVSAPTGAASTIAEGAVMVLLKFINLANGQPMPLHSPPTPHVRTLTPRTKSVKGFDKPPNII